MSVTSPVIACLGGSLRQSSRSLTALQTVAAIAETRGVRADILDLRAMALPMYQPDWEIEDYAEQDQPAIRHLLDSFRQADAFVWSAPTYHGTVSGVFKNAIDYCEYLRDDTPPYIQGRPVGLVSISEQVTFTAMTHIVYGLRGWLAPTQVLLTRDHFAQDTQFSITNERAQARLERLVGELLTFINHKAQV